MNISYNDGTNVVKPYDAKEFAEALEDPKVVKAMIYRPGEIVTHRNGRKYEVGPRGNMIRIRE
jgi:hypothetical protein